MVAQGDIGRHNRELKKLIPTVLEDREEK